MPIGQALFYCLFCNRYIVLLQYIQNFVCLIPTSLRCMNVDPGLLVSIAIGEIFKTTPWAHIQGYVFRALQILNK